MLGSDAAAVAAGQRLRKNEIVIALCSFAERLSL
jgi:hypothetical protein